MISTLIDATVGFNATGAYCLDLSGWDYATVQLVTPASAVSFKGSNDAGAVTGVTDGSPTTAKNFVAVALEDLSNATPTWVTSSAAAGNFKYTGSTKFLQLSGTTAAKVLVELSKIN